MSTLTLTRGLPGSGKTTWAVEQVEDDDNTVRVSRDDLRATVFGGEGVLPWEREKLVTTLQQQMVRTLLAAGKHVIVDDLNLRAKYTRAWADLAVAAGADLRVQDFDTPLLQCINQDWSRWMQGGRHVGEEVIRDLHARFLAAGPLPPVTPTPQGDDSPGGLCAAYVPDESRFPAWIVDLDGTLALLGNRRPYDWALVGQDQPNPAVVEVVKALAEANSIIVMSARDGSCLPQTVAWLRVHGIPYSELHMRAAGDQRKDSIVKAELFDRHVRHRYNVRGVLDDRDQVVALWRGIGLSCMQVAPGAF